MTDEQIKGIARAINPHWWNDDIDLLNFTRVVLSRERAHDEAMLRQALKKLEELRVTIDSEWGGCRDLEEIDAAGDQWPVVDALRERLGETK